jgi:hypothetical protein
MEEDTRFGSYQERCVGSFFSSSQQIKLQYDLVTNDSDNWCKLKNSDISGVACEPKYFLQTAGVDTVESLFRILADVDLKKCLNGKT